MVGLNTSAMIEAAIVGRPVLTVLLPEFRDNQEGTVHFHYLLDGPEALLRASRSMQEHARELAALLEGRDPTRSQRAVRPPFRSAGARAHPRPRDSSTRSKRLPRARRRLPNVCPRTYLFRPMLTPFAHAAVRVSAASVKSDAARRKSFSPNIDAGDEPSAAGAQTQNTS